MITLEDVLKELEPMLAENEAMQIAYAIVYKYKEAYQNPIRHGNEVGVLIWVNESTEITVTR